MAWRDQGYLTVLVIDDDPDLRALVQRVVMSEGHQAIAVGSAEAGLEQLPFNSFDVAFIDQRLPGMDGSVLGEYMHKANPEMEVVIVTGDHDPRLLKMCGALGLSVILKPFEIDAITDVLDRAVRQEAARAKAAEAARGAAERVAGPLDLAAAFPHLPELFHLPGVPQRLEELLGRRVREALERLQLGSAGDEDARAVAYAGIIAAQVLGLKLPRTRSGHSMAQWFDTLMLESGRPPAFHTPGTHADPEADDRGGP